MLQLLEKLFELNCNRQVFIQIQQDKEQIFLLANCAAELELALLNAIVLHDVANEVRL